MISINPVITTNAAGTFTTSLDGMIQGMAMDDPAIRFQLTGGQLAGTETLPMFGGVPIAESIPVPVNIGTPPVPTLPDSALQNSIQRAVAATLLPTGISVFNQNHAMINSPQSQVPQADPGMLVNFYRFGSRARIAMAMDPALVLAGLPVMPTALFYNIVNNWVAAAAGAGGFALPASVNVIGFNIGNSMTVLYDAATGFCNWNRQGSCILLEI
jgi:hypothetical protein